MTETMCGLLFFRQNVRVVNLSITNDYLVPSLSFNVSRSSGNSNSNLASLTSIFGLALRQFDDTAAQSLRFLQNMILRVIFVDYIITRNYCLNKTTLILVVAFLLSVSIHVFVMFVFLRFNQIFIKLADNIYVILVK